MEWSSGGVQCGARPFITSCESTEAFGDPKPLAHHTFVDRPCVLGPRWRTAVAAWESFTTLFGAGLSSYNIKVSSPSYSTLSFFANQEKGIMPMASPPPCVAASASLSASEGLRYRYPALRNKHALAGGDLSTPKVGGVYLGELDIPFPPCIPSTAVALYHNEHCYYYCGYLILPWQG